MSVPASRGVSLVVGVTGHRDLLDSELPVLREQLDAFFLTLAKQFPDLPITVLTALADGADRLAADAARAAGLDVIALLPMPWSDYAEDFDDDAVAEIEQYRRDYDVIELPWQSGEPGVDATDRELQYAHLGVYLAAHSHILLALWDGKASDATGGTAEVVRFHQYDVIDLLASGQYRTSIDYTDDESDLVYQIVCSRLHTGGPAEGIQPGDAFWLTRDDLTPRTHQLPKRYARVFEQMQTFNRDTVAHTAVNGDSELARHLDARGAEHTHGIRRLVGLFEAADELAIRFQQRLRHATLAGYTFALIAGLSFIVYADFPDQETMIYAYLACTAITLTIFSLTQRMDWHRKYLDYRVLAESIRVQYYWAMAGVSMHNRSRFSHDTFLQGRDLDLGWIRNVMRNAALFSDALPRPDHDDGMIPHVIEHWVGTEAGGQLGYYQVKAGDQLNRHLNTTRLTTACFICGLLVAVALAAWQHDLDALANNLMVALMGFLPMLAAARNNYAHRNANRELVAQYAHMRLMFGNARRMLDRTEDPVERREILTDLGEAALHENAQWLLRQRERPLPGGEVIDT